MVCLIGLDFSPKDSIHHLEIYIFQNANAIDNNRYYRLGSKKFFNETSRISMIKCPKYD